MPSFYLPKNLEYVRKALIGILFALLLTPLLLSSKFFFPYISTKTFYFRLLIEIAAALYVLLAYCVPDFRPKWKNPVVCVILSYLGIIFLTSLIGVNFYRSFWGNTERGEGILTFMHVVVFFLILANTLKEEKLWVKFFIFSVLVSFASAIYATLQRFGASFVVAGDVSRLSATIGNASFYAGYLISNIYLAFWLGLKQQYVGAKYLFFGIAVYELIILLATQTRGAFIAILFGMSLFSIFAIFSSKSRRIKIAFVAFLLILVSVCSLIYTFRDSKLVLNFPSLYRFTHISMDDITTQSRLLTWGAGWQGWKDRFLIGYGYENFNVPFNRYFPAEIFRDSGSQIWFDRAHNIFFDVATASGLFGISAYLAIFLLAFWLLWKYYRKDRQNNKVTAAIFFILLVSYFIQNLFVFDTLGTYISFYSVLAFLVFLSAGERQKSAPARIQPFNYILVIPLLVVLLPVSYFAVFKPARANLLITDGLIAAGQGRAQDTISIYKQVIAMNTYANEEARQKLTEAALGFRNDSKISSEAQVQTFRYAIEEMQKAVDFAPFDARDYLFLIALYNNIPTNETGPKEEVINLAHRALTLSPTRPQIYFEMGQASLSLGRFEEGVGYFKKAIELNPLPADSHWNLALAYMLTGHPKEGDDELNGIFDSGGISAIGDGSLKNLIAIYAKTGRYPEAQRIYGVLLKRHPGDAQLLAELAADDGQFCQLDEAQKKVNEAVALEPKFAANAAVFLQQIEEKCKKK